MSLTRIAFVPLPPGERPGFDHADVYRAGQRMYVAHTGAHTTGWDPDSRRLYVFCPGGGGAAVYEELT